MTKKLAVVFSFELDVKHTLHLCHLLVERLRLGKRCVGFHGLRALCVREVDRDVESILVNQDHSLLVEPLYALSVLPETVLDTLFSAVNVGTESMLLALVPPAFVLAPISPVVHAEALFLIVHILAIVPHTVSVDVDSHALHVVRGPLSEVLATVLPQVRAEPVNLVVQPLAFISRSVGPSVLTSALLLAHHVVSLVFGTLGPRLDSTAVLLVLLPGSLVAGTLHVGIDTKAVSFVVEPLAIIDISIRVEEFAGATGLIILPLALVTSIVRPHHRPLAVSQASAPLASVDGASLVGMHLVLQRGIVIEIPCEGLFRFVALEVLALDITGHFQDLVLASHQESTDECLHAAKHLHVVGDRSLLLRVGALKKLKTR